MDLETWKCEGKVWLLTGKRHVPKWAGGKGTFYVKFSIEDPEVQSLVSLVQIEHSNIHSQLQSRASDWALYFCEVVNVHMWCVACM